MAWLTLRPALEGCCRFSGRQRVYEKTLLAVVVVVFEEEATRAFSPGRVPGTNGTTERGGEGLAED